MTETLADTGLPLTDDGWTAELLDVMVDEDALDEIGGDIQVGPAPSFRARFVSPGGDVVMVTQYAYVTAFATERAGLEHDLHGQIEHDDWTELSAQQNAEDARWRVGTDDTDPPKPLVEYGYDVVTVADRWSADNLGEERPDREEHGIPDDRDSASVFSWPTMERAADEARDFIRSVSSTIARDWYPSNF